MWCTTIWRTTWVGSLKEIEFVPEGCWKGSHVMVRTRRSALCGVAMMSCLAGVLVAQSHEVQASVKRQSNDSYAPLQTATSSKPKPEMERLAFLVGTWNASDTYEKSKFAPNRGTGPVFTAALRGWADSLSCPTATTQVRRGESSGYQVLTLDPKKRH